MPATAMDHHVLHVVARAPRAGARRPDQRPRPDRRLHPDQARRQGAGPPAQPQRRTRPSSCTATSARTPAPATWTPSTPAGATTLVATDIAARGIHVDDVALVVHADPPAEHKAYLHRSGRTARAGAAGTVITLMTQEQVRDVRDLTKAAGIKPTITRIDGAAPPGAHHARPRRAGPGRRRAPRDRAPPTSARPAAARAVAAVAAAAVVAAVAAVAARAPSPRPAPVAAARAAPPPRVVASRAARVPARPEAPGAVAGASPPARAAAATPPRRSAPDGADPRPLPRNGAMPTTPQTWLRRALWEQVPRDHRQEGRDLRRRQLVTVGFVLLGGIVLGLSLRLEPGSPWFYPATFALAGIWTVGAFVSGPLHLGRIAFRDRHTRPIITPIALGLGLAAVFVVGRAAGPLDLVAVVPRGPGRLGHRLRRPGLAPDPGRGHRRQRHRRGAVLPRRGVRRHHPLPGALDDRRLRRGHPRDRQRDAGLRRPAARRGRRPGAAGVGRDPRRRC